MLSCTSKGSFDHALSYLEHLKGILSEEMLHYYGMEGKNALIEATPKKTGLTASLWSYDITIEGNKQIITWNNDNIQRGLNIAIIVDNGYVTRSGHRVAGRKYIEKALDPIFEKIKMEVFKEEGR